MKSLLFLVLFSSAAFWEDSANLANITKAIQDGNADALGTYFDTSVEVAVPGQEGMFNKTQAIGLVKTFFSKNKPTSFSQVHKGAPPNNDSQYCIGNLVAGGSTFRVYIYMKNSGGSALIQELRFDKE
ncbi:MAG TPA: DUF4783 domain-containing protein [Saprospiraceae bacterium]|nr:DUF4783 domain-containing protein [Saprospiraceae bacterium]HMQ83569.1 DUF4783 domain-containing protein [Saprospiraceae bacterium]